MFHWFAFLFERKARSASIRRRMILEQLEDRDLPSASVVLASLRDAGLRTQAQKDFLRDGSLTRSDMIAIFGEVDHDGVVTQTELSDLRALVANGSELGMPLYVQDLSGKVVGYDPANKVFQNHTLLPTGQLTAWKTGTQLEDLVDKWFLGEDLPTPTNDDGEVFKYAKVSGSLFGSGGPSNLDVDQGDLGDCYLLSALGAIAAHSPQAIKDMFLDNGDGTFTVRFFKQVGSQEVADFVTVDRELPVDQWGRFIFANMGQFVNQATNVLWVALAEKAYAQLAQSGWSRASDGMGSANSYHTIISGFGGEAMQQIMGEATQFVYTLNRATVASLIADLKAGDLVTIASVSSPPDSSHLVGDHDYYVTGYNASTQRFTVVNPWGASLQNIGTLQLTAAQLQNDFYEFDASAGSVFHQPWH